MKSLRQNAVKTLRQNAVKSLRQNAVKSLRQNAVKSLRQNAVKSLRQNAAPEKVTAIDLFYLRSMDRRATNVLYLLAQYLFRHTKERKSGARLSGGHFIGPLAHHFSLVSDDGLRGLSVVTRELSLIDMGELVKLNISMKVGDDWAWVVQGAERRPVVTDAAPGGAEDAPNIDEGA
ncbi:hypothetical protein Tco_1218888 [Tanacetum coccineum]